MALPSRVPSSLLTVMLRLVLGAYPSATTMSRCGKAVMSWGSCGGVAASTGTASASDTVAVVADAASSFFNVGFFILVPSSGASP